MRAMMNTGSFADSTHENMAVVCWANSCFDSTYLRQLELSQSHLDSLLSDTTSTLSLLSSLSEAFKAVESQTTTFQKQCEGLLKEQRRMADLAEGIESNLKYYSYLEPVTKRLNAPGAGNFVRSKEFSSMLSRLDECLEYMAAHVSRPFRLIVAYDYLTYLAITSGVVYI